MRSAPVCLGFSVATLIPVLIPADTMMGFRSKYLMMQLPRECMMSGTTEATMISSTWSGSSPWLRISSRMAIPYSSDVRGSFVVMRNLATSSSPRNRPIVKFVFPTSIARSIFCLPPCAPGGAVLISAYSSRSSPIKNTL